MRTFVLSGGGNRGAVQAGALQVLLERGVKPELLVGTSAGALNAFFLATDPTPEGGRRLVHIWESVTQADVYPGTYASALWRLLHRAESLYSNANLQRFLERQLDALGVQRFGDISSGVRLYIVATQLDTGEERVFGDEPRDRLLDALMASTALPPLHPPWRCDDREYVDGAVAANLPIRVALARGADDVVALHINGHVLGEAGGQGVLGVTDRTLSAFLQQQVQRELQIACERPGMQLRYIPLTTHVEAPLWDFQHGREMIVEGRSALEAYFDAQAARPADAPESACRPQEAERDESSGEITAGASAIRSEA